MFLTGWLGGTGELVCCRAVANDVSEVVYALLIYLVHRDTFLQTGM